MAVRCAGQRPELACVAILRWRGWKGRGWGRTAGCGDHGVPQSQGLGNELEANAAGGTNDKPDLWHHIQVDRGYVKDVEDNNCEEKIYTSCTCMP